MQFVLGEIDGLFSANINALGRLECGISGDGGLLPARCCCDNAHIDSNIHEDAALGKVAEASLLTSRLWSGRHGMFRISDM